MAHVTPDMTVQEVADELERVRAQFAHHIESTSRLESDNARLKGRVSDLKEENQTLEHMVRQKDREIMSLQKRLDLYE